MAVLAIAVSAATTVSACGSSSSASKGGSSVQQSCTAIGDTLANGPDPSADPVGYAEAQILGLQKLKITDGALNKAVQNLDAAYQAFSSANGTGPSAVQVTAAQNALNAICPGAAG